MARIPTEFRKSADFAATYEFNDIASGLGYQKFYGAVLSKMSGAIIVSGAVLTDNEIYSHYPYLRHSTTGGFSKTKLAELDFDSSDFNLTRVIDGKMLLNFPYYLETGTGSGMNTQFIATLYKVDGTTETFLVSGQTLTQEIAASASGSGYCAMELEIPKTKITNGDKLRITAEWYVTSTAGAGQTAIAVWSFDPANRDPLSKFDSGTSTEFYIPFVIDL